MIPPAPIAPRSLEQARANVEPGPQSDPPRGMWTNRYGLILGMMFTAVTFAAIVLAIVGPQESVFQSANVPATFTKVTDGPINSPENWALPSGCSISADGLQVGGSTSGTACVFQPSDAQDLTSQGFWLEVALAPSSDVPGQVGPIIAIGESVQLTFSDQGAYEICTSGSFACDRGSASSWHTDTYVANTVSVRYLHDSHTLTVYANGREVTSRTMTVEPGAGISLGAGSGASAIFTHMALYTASASLSAPTK